MNEALNAPPANIIAVPITSEPCCDITIIRASGEKIVLGRPGTIGFFLRRMMYKFKIYMENKNG